MDPVFVCVPDDCLGCRTYNKLLFELGCRVYLDASLVVVYAQTIVGNYGTLLSEAFHVLSLTTEERLWNKQWEISVLCASFLKHKVQLMLHFLPYSIAVGFDDHTSANCGLFGKVGLGNNVVVPLAVILRTFCQMF